MTTSPILSGQSFSEEKPRGPQSIPIVGDIFNPSFDPTDENRILSVEEAAQGIIILNGRKYDPVDKDSTFEDWLDSSEQGGKA